MKIRTKLTLVFFLLAVVPLTGIVFYNYISSLETFRQAVEREVRAEADNLAERLDIAKADLADRLQAFGTQSLQRAGTLAHEGGQATLQRGVAELGDFATMVESVEVIPAIPDAPAGIAPPRIASELHLTEPPTPLSLPESVVIYLDTIAEEVSDADNLDDAREQAMRVTTTFLEELGNKVEVVGEAIEAGSERLDEEQAAREEQVAELDEVIRTGNLSPEERRQLEREQMIAERALNAIARQRSRLEAKEIEKLQYGWEKAQKFLGENFEWKIRRDGEVLGEVRAQISPEQLVGAVLSQTRREQGEIPFAVDGEGHAFFATPEDEAALAELNVGGLAANEEATTRMAYGNDWLLVASPDPDSETVVGIARPLAESLSAMRRNAARNFGLGLGMITLALIGIMPLSSRMTRNLTKLASGVDEMARGNLDVKIDVASQDEIGHLAMAVNRMASDLEENQEQLIGEVRRRKEQETREQLLAAENERKSRELEDARKFQLSLLPDSLPDHPDLEIEVHMQTATEVGGDYYDFLTGPDGQLTVAVGDATGHGATAGTMVTAIKSLFMAGAGDREPSAFLTESSRAIHRMRLGRMAMALTIARFDSGRLTLAAAGMPPALVWRSRDSSVEEVAITGMPLGGLEGSSYQQIDLHLAPGDTVLMMTDGYPELSDPDGEPLGYTNVRQHFESVGGGSPHEILAALEERARDWRQDRALLDDITFVVMRCNGSGLTT